MEDIKALYKHCTEIISQQMKSKHLWTGKRKPFQPRISNSDSSATSLLLTYQDYLDLSNNRIKFISWICWKGFFIVCTILLHENTVWKGMNKSGFLARCSAWQIWINLAGVKRTFCHLPSFWPMAKAGCRQPEDLGCSPLPGDRAKKCDRSHPCLRLPAQPGPTTRRCNQPPTLQRTHLKSFLFRAGAFVGKDKQEATKWSVFTALTQLIINHSQVVWQVISTFWLEANNLNCLVGHISLFHHI